MTNIILCGGNGTRLWPVSRSLMPKQFVRLFDNKSLFQLTLERNYTLCHNHLIVSNEEQYFLAFDQVDELNPTRCDYVLEPIGRNTAPAIALSCLSCDPEEIVLVTPSDQLIGDLDEYNKAVLEAKQLAKQGALVTFGINPTEPHTGYGYIECTNNEVRSFKEKPDFDTASEYLSNGNYYWNSGMFCFQAGVFLEELKKYSPDIYETCVSTYENVKDSEPLLFLKSDMVNIPSDSIDYAVMEKSNIVKMVKSNFHWSDLGSFDSLYNELPKDCNNNSINPDHISINSKNNLVFGNERKIATVDVEDLIIIDTGDALLVSKKGSSEKVKDVVNEIKKTTTLHNIHLTGYRPWGSYTVLEDSPGYKIKRIEVNPGKRLSLQKHFHRNEHWIVVSGTATVTVGEKTSIITANESTYIKMGEVHRLENEGLIPLVLIEVQVGEYTGEDDIVRIEDDFKRN